MWRLLIYDVCGLLWKYIVMRQIDQSLVRFECKMWPQYGDDIRSTRKVFPPAKRSNNILIPNIKLCLAFFQSAH